MKIRRDNADRAIRKLVPELRISTLGDFFSLVDVFSRYNGSEWLFRGEDDASYGLRPKIGRPDRKVKITNAGVPLPIPYKRTDEELAIERFMNGALAFGPYSGLKQIEWLALAQHHGLPTRLLDWTENFAAAAWFAVRTPRTKVVSKGGGHTQVRCEPAIWAIRGVVGLKKSELDSVFDLQGLRIYRPPHIDGRIRAQQGVFTVHHRPDEDAVVKSSYKFVVEPRLCFLLSKRLHALGINQGAMFPDLDGLASHVGWLYRNNWLGRSE